MKNIFQGLVELHDLNHGSPTPTPKAPFLFTDRGERLHLRQHGVFASTIFNEFAGQRVRVSGRPNGRYAIAVDRVYDIKRLP